jgi:2,4-dienoyl-CoA reductase-like NADH-dependent reductase (Old Yellow Enzyme family)
MCQYSSEDGFANDWHLVHLGSRAAGGAGLVFTEAAAVSPEGRITPDDLGLWKEDHIVFLKRISAFIESMHAVPGIQLAHAGRKASNTSPWKGARPLTQEEGAWQTVGPSSIPYRDGQPAPVEMSKEDIEKVINDFKRAASFAIDAGFKVAEIHAAHGYLLNNFLSPLSNKRKDAYGGSFENRCRLLMEVIDAVQSCWPAHYPLFVRISASDWVDGGWTMEDSVELSKMLLQKSIDLIDCSSGGNSPLQKIPVAPMYQVDFASRIKTETGMRTGAVGLITTAQQAEAILNSDRADLIFLARQVLRDPYFALHAARELETDVAWPDQYLRAKRS